MKRFEELLFKYDTAVCESNRAWFTLGTGNHAQINYAAKCQEANAARSALVEYVRERMEAERKAGYESANEVPR